MTADARQPDDRSSPSYWRSNLRLTVALLVVWFAAGPCCGILFADQLNEFHLGGFPLGFWFAQQGSILVFVLLILVYAVCLNILDHRHRGVTESLPLDAEPTSESEAASESSSP